MKTHFSKILLAIFFLLLTLSPVLGRAAYSQASAVAYLQANGNNAWTTLALSAANASPNPGDYLKLISSSKATDYETAILAITSLNQNPRTFGSTDYVAKLESFHNSSQMGDPGLLNDDFFGILALVSAGLPVTDVNVSDSKTFIISSQNQNGGWSYAPGSASDTDDTAAAITALIAAGVPASDSHIVSALSYIRSLQNSDGGFPSDPSYDALSNSSSTSWVLWALKAAGVDQSTWAQGSNNPLSFLASYQNADGSFKWEAADTTFYPTTAADAVIALAGKTLPLNIFSQAQTFPTVNFRIEGSASTVCAGAIAAQTAMDVIKNAAANCGYTYNIIDSGTYLNQINSDAASGQTGWLYLDNNVAPSASASAFQVKDGDSVLWYFGMENQQPLKLDLSSATASSGQSVTATVSGFSGTGFTPLSGAAVYFGAQTSGATDQNGQAQIAPADGYYKVFAQKSGYIRSNTVLLKIGQPSSSNLALNANYSGGQVAGTSTQTSVISFSVDSGSLNFGNISAGSKASKDLTITNNGTGGITLAGAVSGDPLFTGNLSLNSQFWQNFSSGVAAGQSQKITAALNVPANFNSASGLKSGQLIIWATAQ